MMGKNVNGGILSLSVIFQVTSVQIDNAST